MQAQQRKNHPKQRFPQIGLLWNWNLVRLWNPLPVDRLTRSCLHLLFKVDSLRFLGFFLTFSVDSFSLAVQSLASPAYLHFLATSTAADGQSLLLYVECFFCRLCYCLSSTVTHLSSYSPLQRWAISTVSTLFAQDLESTRI
jgi:hypothetical protein